MSKQLHVNLGFTADTTQARTQIMNLQAELTKLTHTPVSLFGNGKTQQEINSAIRGVAELQHHLKMATNINTGTLDFAKLSDSIKKSGTNLQAYGEKLRSLGPAGQTAFNQLATAVAQSEVPIRRSNAMLTQFATTLKNTARWQLSSSMLRGFMSAIRTSVGYAKDLNKALTDIRIVTGNNIEQMAKFAEQANRAAKALSTTTTDYTKASLIYFQQGLSESEVKERTEITMKMAAVSRQSAEEVSNQMTAVWNNFSDGTKTLESFADAMTALGAKTASSSDEIAGGLEKFAAVGKTIGLSFDYAAAALATITARTRESEEVVGTALKTIFARIQGLKLGESLEDGTDLNKYSQALATVGISIKDQNGELKDMDTILDEMGAKWKVLSRDQQTALAQTVAGVRQYNQLMALMSNWDFMKENLETINSSTGTLNKQHETYAEGWEASSKRVRAAAEGIFNDLLDDDAFIKILNNVEEFLSFIDQLIEGIGGLRGVVTTLGAVLTKVFSSQIAQSMSTMATNLKLMTADGRAAYQKERATVIKDYADKAGETEFGLKTEAGKARSKALESNLALQEKLILNEKNLTEEEKNANKVLIDRNRILGENAVKAAEALDASIDKRSDAKTRAHVEMATQDPGNYNDNKKKFNIRAQALGNIIQQQETLQIAMQAAGDESLDLEEKIKKVRQALVEVGTESDEIDKIEKELREAGGSVEALEQKMGRLKSAETNMKTNMIYDNLTPNQVRNYNRMSGTTAANLVQGGTGVSKQSVENYTNAVRENIRAKQDNIRATQNLKDSEDVIGNTLDKNAKKQMDWSQKLTQTSSGIMSMFSALSMLQGAIHTLKNPDMSAWEKFVSLGMTFSMMIPMVVQSFKTLNFLRKSDTIQTGLNTVAKLLNYAASKKSAKGALEEAGAKKISAEANKEEAATELLGAKKSGIKGWAKNVGQGGRNLVGAMGNFIKAYGGVAAGIAIAAASITAAIKLFNKASDAAKKAVEEADMANQMYKSTQEAYNTFKGGIDEYESGRKGLEGLQKGTLEYEEALMKANDAARDLISANNLLSDSYHIDEATGLITINEEKLKAIQEQRLLDVKNAQHHAISMQNEAKKAQIESDKIDLMRKKMKAGGGFSEEDGSWMLGGVGGGLGAGLAVGATIGGSAGPIGAAIGAAVGAIAGGIGAAVTNDAEDEEDKALKAIKRMYDLEGETVFANFDETVEKVADGNNELATSLLDNEVAIRDLIRSEGELEKAIIEQNKKEAQDNNPNLTDDEASAFASETMQELMKYEAQKKFDNELKNDKDKNKKFLEMRYGDQAKNYKIEDEKLFGQELVIYKLGDGGKWEKTDEPIYTSEARDEAILSDYKNQLYKDKDFIKKAQDKIDDYTKMFANMGVDIIEAQESGLIAEAAATGGNYNKTLLYGKIKQVNVPAYGINRDDPDFDNKFRKKVIEQKYKENSDDILDLVDITASKIYALDETEDLPFFDDNGSKILWKELTTKQKKQYIKERSEYSASFQVQNWDKLSQDEKDYYAMQFGEIISKSLNGFLSDSAKAYIEEEKTNYLKALSLLRLVPGQNNELTTDEKYGSVKGYNDNFKIDEEDILSVSRLDSQFIDWTQHKQYREDVEGILVSYKEALSTYFDQLTMAERDFLIKNLDFNTLDVNGATPEEMIKQIEETLVDSLISQESAGEATLYGLDAGTTNELAQAFYDEGILKSQNAFTENIQDAAEAASDAAIRYQRLNQAIMDLHDNEEAYTKVIKDAASAKSEMEKIDVKQNENYKKLKTSLANLLGTSEDFIDIDMVAAIDPKDFEKAADGNLDAIEKIRDAFIEMQAEGEDINFDALKSEINDLFTLAGEGGVIDIDESPLLMKLLQAKVAAGAEAAEIEQLLSGFNIDADITPIVGSMEELEKAAQEAGTAIIENGSYSTEMDVTNVTENGSETSTGVEENITTTNHSLDNVTWEATDDSGMVHPVGLSGNVWEVDKESIATPTTVPKKDSFIAKAVRLINGKGETSNQVNAIKISQAHKSVGNIVSPSTKSYVSDTGKKGGGGGKKSKAKQSRPTKKSEVVERYKEIGDKLSDINKEVEKTSSSMDKLWGNNRIKAMEKYSQQLREQLGIQKEYQKQAKRHLGEDRAELEQFMLQAPGSANILGGLGDMGLQFTFDEKGNISNYTQVMTALYEKLKGLEQERNSIVDTEKQSEFEENTLEPFRERLSILEELIGAYDETLGVIEDKDSEIQETINQINENRLNEIDYRIQIQTTFNEQDLKWIDYSIKKLENNFEKVGEIAALNSGKIDNYFKALELSYKPYNDRLWDYQNRLNNVSLDQVIAEADEAIPNMISALEQIQSLDEEMLEYYSDALSRGQQKFEKYSKLFEAASSELEHYEKMLSLIGEQKNYNKIDTVLQGQYDVAQNAVAADKAYYETLQYEYTALHDRWLKEKDTLDGYEKQMLEQKLYDAQLAVNEAEDEYLSSLETTAEIAQKILENSLEKIRKELEENLFETSAENYMEDLNRLNKKQEEYLTNTNKMYETNKLIRQAQMDMDKTSNLRAKQQYNEYVKYIEQLQESGELSSYELSIAQQKYKVLQAQIALEEAQEAKGQVRLTRDNEGNYGYVYTADEDKIGEAEQALADANNELYNIGLKGAQDYQTKYAQTMKEAVETFAKINEEYQNGEIASEEEYNRRMSEAREHYYDLLKQYNDLYYTGYNLLVEESYENQADYLLMGIGDLEDFADYTGEYISDANSYFDEYNTNTSEVTEIVGKNLGELKQKTGDVTEKTDELAEEIKDDLIPELQREWQRVRDVTSMYALQRGELDKTIQTYDELIKRMQEVQKLGGKDYSGISDFSLEIEKMIKDGYNINDPIVQGLLEARWEKMGGVDNYNYKALMNEYLTNGGKETDSWYQTLELLRDFKVLKTNWQSLQMSAEAEGNTELVNSIWGIQQEKFNVDYEKEIADYLKIAGTSVSDAYVQDRLKARQEMVDNAKYAASLTEDTADDKAANAIISNADMLDKILENNNKEFTEGYNSTTSTLSAENTAAAEKDKEVAEQRKENNGSFIYPLEGGPYAKHPQGYFGAPRDGGKRAHAGQDISGYYGTNVLASQGGVITIAKSTSSGGYGRYIDIDHQNGYVTRYAHLSNVAVAVGDTVKQGDIIGNVGGSGYGKNDYYGTHLHFEIRKNNKAVNPTDYVALDTGGYTGEWGPEGRLAMLHEKELILNKKDTENFLTATNMLREISQMLDNNALVASLGAINLQAMRLNTLADQVLQQEVTIHADFPNVTDHNEIEIAIDNLINAASQHAYRT